MSRGASRREGEYIIGYHYDIALRQKFLFFLLLFFFFKDSWNGNNGPGVSTFWLAGWMDGWMACLRNKYLLARRNRKDLFVFTRFSLFLFLFSSFSSFMIYVTSGTAKGYPSVEDCKWNLSLGL